MAYYKTLEGNKVISISIVNDDGNGNITKSEYDILCQVFKNKPSNKTIIDNGDGTYKYDEKSEEEYEPSNADKAEAYDILVGEAT